MASSDSSSSSSMGYFGFIIAVLTSMISYTMHSSYLWAILAFIFSPFVWLKWIIYQDINLSIIRATFPWFFN